MFYYFKSIFNLIFFDKFEKLYLDTIDYRSKINSPKKKIILIETIPDYYYLSYYTTIFNDRFKDCHIIGYWPDLVTPKSKSKFILIKIFKYFRSGIFQFLLKRKWKKLYNQLGIQEFYDYEDLKKTISNNEIKKMKTNSKKIFKNIKEKKDIFKIYINNLYVGDLIYDTYIRFRNEPTVDIKDQFLYEIIERSHIFTKCFANLIKSKNINDFYFAYTSYVVHGIPARLATQLNKIVYTDGNYQYNKKINKNDLRHVENVNNLKKIFQSFKQKNKKISISKKKVNNFFYKKNINSQKGLYNYMNLNSYNSNFNIKNNDLDFEVVIFLPNFFECQREWGKIIFNDFYEWIIFTLDYFNKLKVKIAIKPHPNIYSLHPENKKVIEFLKKNYNKHIWLNPKLPNKIIFNKTKLAISPWGSVLWELAYFNIPNISIGENPGKKFNLSFNPKNIQEYKNLLKNYKKLKNNVSKKTIYEFIYVYMLNNNDDYRSIARNIQLKKIDLTISKGLEEFIKKFKSYENNL
jgi:hypothetical protein